MATSRYQKDQIIGSPQRLATAAAIVSIRAAVSSGRISTREITTVGDQRLDQIAGSTYGDGKLWWVIAAASGIGWWLQVPSGTRLIIPTDVNAVMALV
jgi:nucleoid-associated protein YgaU